MSEKFNIGSFEHSIQSIYKVDIFRYSVHEVHLYPEEYFTSIQSTFKQYRSSDFNGSTGHFWMWMETWTHVTLQESQANLCRPSPPSTPRDSYLGDKRPNSSFVPGMFFISTLSIFQDVNLRWSKKTTPRPTEHNGSVRIELKQKNTDMKPAASASSWRRLVRPGWLMLMDVHTDATHRRQTVESELPRSCGTEPSSFPPGSAACRNISEASSKSSGWWEG